MRGTKAMDEMIEVIAYAGYRGEEVPRTFSLHGKRIEVVEVTGAWTEEGLGNRARKRFFKIRGSDGRAHQIYHTEQTSAWFYVQNKQE